MGDAGGQWEEFEKIISQITDLDQLVLAGEAAFDSYDGEERRFLETRDQLCENHCDLVIELLEARREVIIAQEIDLSAVPPGCRRRGHQTTTVFESEEMGRAIRKSSECNDVRYFLDNEEEEDGSMCDLCDKRAKKELGSRGSGMAPMFSLENKMHFRPIP